LVEPEHKIDNIHDAKKNKPKPQKYIDLLVQKVHPKKRQYRNKLKLELE
jgi:hypothetical protein